MLKKTFMIYTLAIFAVVGVNATIEQQINEEILKQTEEESQKVEGEKDLAPGLLVCNGKEDKCLKNDDQQESSSSILFSVFNEDDQDEMNLLACKDCR